MGQSQSGLDTLKQERDRCKQLETHVKKYLTTAIAKAAARGEFKCSVTPTKGSDIDDYTAGVTNIVEKQGFQVFKSIRWDGSCSDITWHIDWENALGRNEAVRFRRIALTNRTNHLLEQIESQAKNGSFRWTTTLTDFDRTLLTDHGFHLLPDRTYTVTWESEFVKQGSRAYDMMTLAQHSLQIAQGVDRKVHLQEAYKKLEQLCKEASLNRLLVRKALEEHSEHIRVISKNEFSRYTDKIWKVAAEEAWKKFIFEYPRVNALWTVCRDDVLFLRF